MQNLKQKKIQKLIECFKFHCITGHLKLNNVLLLADTSCNFTHFMQALMKMYKQACQLIIQRMAKIMDGSDINTGLKCFACFHIDSDIWLLRSMHRTSRLKRGTIGFAGMVLRQPSAL